MKVADLHATELPLGLLTASRGDIGVVDGTGEENKTDQQAARRSRGR